VTVTSSRSRLVPAALLALALALLPWRAEDCAGGKMKDFEEHNVQVELPDGNQPGTWDWESVAPKLAEEHGAKAMGKRHPEFLKDGKTPNEGHGARVMLTVQDVPASLDPDYETWLRDLFLYEQELGKLEGQEGVPQEQYDQVKAKRDETRKKVDDALLALAGRPEVQAALLHRFGDAGKSLAKVRSGHEIDTLPAAVVEVGERSKPAAANHLGGVQSACVGKMVVWVIRKRFYRLAMWAWPVTKDGKVKDPEHFVDDLDFLEMNSITIPKKEPIPRRPDEAPPSMPKGSGGAGAPAEASVGTPGEIIRELPFAFQVQKPDGWRKRELDRSKEDDRYMGFQIDSVANREGDHAIVELLVYRVEMGAVVGFKAGDHFVRSFKTFLNEHKTGALATHTFPVINAKTPYLSLPDGKRRELKRPESLDEVGDQNDLEKMAVVSEAKGARIKENKLRFPWRFCVVGVQERGLPETLVQYVWSTDKITFLLRVTLRGEAQKTQAAQLKTVLSSFEILGE
jgi:hypothetical protein